MKFACSSCGKRYVLSDGKVADKRNVRLKCKACGETITVKRDGELVVELITSASVAPTASEAPAALAESVPPLPPPPVELRAPEAKAPDTGEFANSSQAEAAIDPAPEGEPAPSVPPPPAEMFQVLDEVNASQQLPPLDAAVANTAASAVLTPPTRPLQPPASPAAVAEQGSTKRLLVIVAVALVVGLVMLLVIM